MNACAREILATAALTTISACGPSGGVQDSGTWDPQVTPSSSSSASGPATQAGSPSAGSDASPTAVSRGTSPRDSGAAVPTKSASPDASVAGPPASSTDVGEAGPVVGDAGAAPYKGVANSACADLTRLGVSWYYNWTLSPGSCTTSQFVPMLWGHTGNEQTAAGIGSAIRSIVSAGYKTILGFNEPDNSSQSNISVQTAISLWPSFINTAQVGVRVGSPATQANSTGQAWFTNFMNQVNADTTGALRVDFIAAHWYGWNAGSCDANASALEGYIRWLEAIPGNRPIWLTEWGCLNQSNPTAAVVQAFFSGAIAMFGRHPRIERYAWYPWTTNNELVANDGTLTALGTVFSAAPASR
jgi:Glycosyl hydrolase catalytic core